MYGEFYYQNDQNLSCKPLTFLNNWQHPVTNGYSINSNAGKTANTVNWIFAVSAILDAISSTPISLLTKQKRKNLNIIANILEVVGITIDTETEKVLLNKIGAQIVALGNLTAVAGLLSKNDQVGQLLEKQGEQLQVIGDLIIIDTEQLMNFEIGNLLEDFGYAIELLADEESKEGEILEAVGTWIQAVGAVITALTPKTTDGLSGIVFLGNLLA